MALSESLIDRLFARLALRYGIDFARRYEGLDLNAVKTDWAIVLGVYEKNLKPIRYALDNLPVEKPPNALEFLQICRQYRPQPQKTLPAPRSQMPAEVKQQLDQYLAKFKPGGAHRV